MYTVHSSDLFFEYTRCPINTHKFTIWGNCYGGGENMKNHAAIKNTENLKASYLKRFKEKLGVNCQSIVVMYFFSCGLQQKSN